MGRTRIKVCGITCAEQAVAAARFGIDAVGLVFYGPSPRAIGVAPAQAVCAALPPFVTVVGLFVDAPREWVRSVLAQVPLDLLQFHGEEDPDYCSAFTRPYIKAVRMRVGVDTVETARRYRTAAAWLFDSYAPNAPGGTGETFDWTRVPQGLEKPVVLAGGLTPENVGVAIRTVRPYAVDVSGGVEGQKGIKDIAKMAAFVRSVDYVDREQSDG